jgi:hypothetical protein
MPINPFEGGGPVPALPPDIYNLEWLSRVNRIGEALVYGAAAVLCVLIYTRGAYRG